MKTMIAAAALIALTGVAHAGAYDKAACEMVVEDFSVYHHPANPDATRTDPQLTARQLEIRLRRTENAIRQLGGWDLLDDYSGASFDTVSWLNVNGPRLKALPPKAARDELKAYIGALCA